jgi:hypothetical protein
MMYQVSVPLIIRYKVFKEVFKTATQLDGLMAVTIQGKVATTVFLDGIQSLRTIFAPGVKPVPSR